MTTLEDVDGFTVTEGYISHPLLVDGVIENRGYQAQLFAASRHDHTLVTLPTGLGKTTVSLLLTAHRLHQFGGKALLLAPTKPLVNQHANFYREALDIFDEQITVFTGEVQPDDRAELWEESTVIIATPQVIENDLVGNRISLDSVVHCTFDECHRATGNYAYCYIGDRYHAQATTPLVTAMSASPGGDQDQILAVCQNLGVTNVEVMTEADADIDEYTYDTDVTWQKISLPAELLEVRDELKQVIKNRMGRLKQLGVASSKTKDVSQSDINRMRGQAQSMIDDDESDGYTAMSLIAEIQKLKPTIQTLESQGIGAFAKSLTRIKNEAKSSGGSKASKRLMSDSRVQQALDWAESYDKHHPKLQEARRHVIETLTANDHDARIIIFTESRDTAEFLSAELGKNFDVHRFVGQNDKEGSEGMTQTEQKDTLERFRNDEFDVLISTSVAEEGLDVPEVDLVLFYEPVPESVRLIQRKGRTGRQKEGKVVVLIGADTRDGVGGNTTDETYYWISQRREQEMHDEIAELKDHQGDIEDLLPDNDHALDHDDGDGVGNTDAGETGTETSGESDTVTETDGEDQLTLADAVTTADGDDTTATDQMTAGDDMVADSAADTQTADTDTTETSPGELSTPITTDADTVEIVADQRELDAHIPKHLSTKDDVETRLETLEVGDYILSDRVAVERKEVDDFLSSLIGDDRDIFQQITELATYYQRPVLIIEGDGLYSTRNIHPDAIRGALASLAVDFEVSVLRTSDTEDTAALLQVIADREQSENEREVSIHGKKAAKTMSEQQEYVVSAIADIGPVTAQRLLDAFGSVRAVMNATEDELRNVDGIGEVTATQIQEVVTTAYEP